MEETTRLNKYLANLGVAARRDIKAFLKNQVVTVNGNRVKESGFRVIPEKDDIRLNGNKIKAPELLYYLINKPMGIVSTTADEYGRKNVTSLIPTTERIYPVGRLDKDTTGLLILTNDGGLTNLLTHPKYHVDKVYMLQVEGIITNAQIKALTNGVLLDDGITAPARVILYKNGSMEMTIHEGRNRQIRRMCETVGITLVALERIKFGPLSLSNLKVGKYRELTLKEVQILKNRTSEK
jgi:23S rRNA pseudouridine2605 synthase